MSNDISSVMSIRVWGMLMLLSFVWGGSFFFHALLVKELPPMTIVFLRVALAAVFIWIYIAFRKIRVPKSIGAWVALACMGVLNNVLPFSLIVWGQTIISSSLASVLNATMPMFTVVLAATLLKDENITPLKTMGVVVGFIGTAIIIGPDLQSTTGNQFYAQLAILAAAISYSFAGIFGRRFSRMDLHPVTTAAGQVTSSAILILPIVLLIDQPASLPMPSGTAIAALLGLASFSTAFAYILYFRILAAAGATNLGLVTFLIPVWAGFFGIWLLAEKFSTHQLIGIIVIALGLSLIDGRIWNRLKKAA